MLQTKQYNKVETATRKVRQAHARRIARTNAHECSKKANQSVGSSK